VADHLNGGRPRHARALEIPHGRAPEAIVLDALALAVEDPRDLPRGAMPIKETGKPALSSGIVAPPTVCQESCGQLTIGIQAKTVKFLKPCISE
jgi:hypothetical protein